MSEMNKNFAASAVWSTTHIRADANEAEAERMASEKLQEQLHANQQKRNEDWSILNSQVVGGEFSMCASSVACNEIHEALQSARDELAEVKADREKWQGQITRLICATNTNNVGELCDKYEQLRDENERLRKEAIQLKKEHDSWLFNAKELQKQVNGWELQRALLMDVAKASIDVLTYTSIPNHYKQRLVEKLAAARAGGIVI